MNDTFLMMLALFAALFPMVAILRGPAPGRQAAAPRRRRAD